MLQYQDIAYFFLMVSIWTSVLAISSPGTGLLELAACICIVVTSLFAAFLGFNIWALGILVAGLLFFLLEIARPLKGIFILVSIILFSVGSVFLFQDGEGTLAVVSWPLAVISSIGTALFFWIVVRKIIQTHRKRPHMDPTSVVGQVGIAATEILHEGSVQVASELWSARSETLIPAGSHVRVVSLDGLVLTVVKEA
jgi:membrane-bound serine protease (ClpP class)